MIVCDKMGIQKIQEIPRLPKHINIKLDTRYVCDLCGAQFAHKHDAKAHHKNRHISDKFVLSNLEGKWYKQRGSNKYMHILNIDYSRNRVKIYIYEVWDSKIYLYHNVVNYNLSIYSKYIPLNEFKSDVLQNITRWDVVDFTEVWSCVEASTENIKNMISKEDDLFGN